MIEKEVPRGPRGVEVEQEAPQLAATAEVAQEVGPGLADLLGGYEQPHVPRVGLAKEGTHPVGLLGGIRGGELLSEIGDRRVRPPKEVRARLGGLERRVRGG